VSFATPGKQNHPREAQLAECPANTGTAKMSFPQAAIRIGTGLFSEQEVVGFLHFCSSVEGQWGMRTEPHLAKTHLASRC